ncbi:hypothetical protein FA95DRAFT_1533835 [Auriscalpium vulgare]|uniref:Uncharacterized protein n=1 Tax=Auriscalpium vulgare TaxID=40419 RepID=A0ACB8S7R2_9AGAM|nr:hypothetical protein FA95DRAFT_1533835 [Auriscalpium vulgare]
MDAIKSLTEEQQTAIEVECSTDDIKSTLTDVLKDPRLYVHVRRVHDDSVYNIHEAAERNTSNKRKRKREVVSSSSSEDVPELSSFKNALNGINLKSWCLPPGAALYTRGPKNSDINTLANIKKCGDGSDAFVHSAVITISVHNRVSWTHNYVSRFSQHAVLSDQTMGDLFDVIPCPFNELPQESQEDGQFVGYGSNADGSLPAPSGYVMVIEGVAYGDGLNEVDYSDKLIAHVPSPPIKGPAMHETKFSSLSLRINKPYWLLHQGNCEHFLVVDQIRLLHPDDFASGYPLTVQITPPLLDNCRACGKVPAVHSIIGDVRLGESPCLMCAPCWRIMGAPQGKDAEGVMVVPLPSHHFGW